MSKLLFLFMLCIAISACKNNNRTNSKFSYPDEIVHYNLEAKYDSAKMLIYEAQLGIWGYGYPMQELYEKKPMNKTSFTSCELELSVIHIRGFVILKRIPWFNKY